MPSYELTEWIAYFKIEQDEREQEERKHEKAQEAAAQWSLKRAEIHARKSTRGKNG